MTPSPTPVLSLDPIGIVIGVSNALKGGTFAEILAGILMFLAVVFYFVFKGQITERQRQAAADQTNANSSSAHQGAAINSGSQEAEVALAQATLHKAEKDALRKMLDTYSDTALLQGAFASFGPDKLEEALGFAALNALGSPLSLESRANIYLMYGVHDV